MKKRNAQGNIISLVLIILLVLVLVVIIWNVVFAVIKKSSSQINVDVFTNKLSIVNITITDPGIRIKIRRDSGNDNITSLKFIFYDDKGGSKIVERNTNIPYSLETKSFNFDSEKIRINDGKIVKIEVIPYFTNNPGMKVSEEKFKDIIEKNLFPGLSGEKITIDQGTGEETIEPSVDAWDKFGYWPSSILETSSETNSEWGFSVSIKGYIELASKNLIEIDPEKTYYQEAWFKSVGSQNSKLYFGYIPYDRFYREIQYYNIAYIKGSETELYEASLSTDKTIKIKDGSKWKFPSENYNVAFNIDDSGSYNDLPNFNLSNFWITNVENKGSYWEVTFNTNVGASYPAGTKVREHISGGTYMYNSARHVSVPDQWTKYSSEVSGFQEKGIEEWTNEDLTNWRKGTKYIKVLVLGNYAQDSNYITLMDDLKVVKKD